MNLRRLKYFVKIVDIGSLTQAADVLHIAQPALSQQLATLEGEVRQQLLVRTKRGVTPTEAGKVLYRHAQLILRQCEQARVDMNAAGRGPVGRGVGRARARHRGGGAGAAAAAHRARAPSGRPALPERELRHHAVRAHHERPHGPGRALRRQGRGARPDVPAAAAGARCSSSARLACRRRPRPCRCDALGDIDLYLPRPYNVVRKLVDEAFVERRHGAARGGRDRVGQHADRRHRRWAGRDHPAGIDGARGGGVLRRLAVAASSSRRSRRRWRCASPTTCRCPSRRRR